MEERIRQLEMQVHNLQLAFDSMSRSQTTTVGRVDDTSNNLSSTDNSVEINTANIDYIAMMSDIDIPTEV